MSINAIYQAKVWAKNKTNEEIQKEITWHDKRYYRPYPFNSAENAQATLDRIFTLEEILREHGIEPNKRYLPKSI